MNGASRLPKPRTAGTGIPVFTPKIKDTAAPNNNKEKDNKENEPKPGPSKQNQTLLVKPPRKLARKSVLTTKVGNGQVSRVSRGKIRKSNRLRTATVTSAAVRSAINAANRAITTKPITKPKTTTTKTTTTAASRAPVKRPAAPTTTKSTTTTNAKVAKVMTKPAPYDYKARFTQLLEKHKELKEQCSTFEKEKDEFISIKQKLAECESNLETTTAELEDTKNKLKTETEEYKNLKALHDTLTKEHQELTKKYEDMVQKEASLRKTYEVLEKHAQFLQEERDKLAVFEKAYNEREKQCRELNNLVQDLKGNIRVFCRVRPPKKSEEDRFECSINYTDECTMEIKKDRESFSISGKPTDLKQEFTFDKVFPPNSTQSEVFEDLGQLVQSALDGYHVCVFAYGQTGSGKTFTMQGESSNEGMIPRSINLLFQKIKEFEKLNWHYTVQCNFLEIYNENIKDLLNPNGKLSHDILFNEGKGTTVTNVITKMVKSSKELINLMYTAQQNRAVAATNYNEHSSRSHFVAKIIIEGRKEGSLYYGSINLVDLAGSESAKNTERIEETKNINKSLSALGNVMLALHNKENHIPYRNSKLTYLLQSCLGGNSKTLMFVNISPFEDCYNESINSLRFAAKVKTIKVNVKRNKICAK